MKELLTELRNKVLYLRNTEELSAKGELILLHKLNALEKQFAISGVVSTYVRYLGVPTWGLSTNSHYELLDYNDSKYKIKDNEGNIDWWCKKSFEKL